MVAAQELSSESSRILRVSDFRTLIPYHRFIRIIGVSRFTTSLLEQSVDVWGTIKYGDLLAVIKKTGKQVSFYLFLMMLMGTHNILGYKWERGKSLFHQDVVNGYT